MCLVIFVTKFIRWPVWKVDWEFILRSIGLVSFVCFLGCVSFEFGWCSRRRFWESILTWIRFKSIGTSASSGGSKRDCATVSFLLPRLFCFHPQFGSSSVFFVLLVVGCFSLVISRLVTWDSWGCGRKAKMEDLLSFLCMWFCLANIEALGEPRWNSDWGYSPYLGRILCWWFVGSDSISWEYGKVRHTSSWLFFLCVSMHPFLLWFIV